MNDRDHAVLHWLDQEMTDFMEELKANADQLAAAGRADLAQENLDCIEELEADRRDLYKPTATDFSLN